MISHGESLEKSSMLYWYPLIKDLPIKQPETYIVTIPKFDFNDIVEGKVGLEKYEDKIDSILKKLEPYPIFMRTDQTSQKHSYEKTCRINSKKNILPNVRFLIEANMMSWLDDSALIFRKWVDFEGGFTAFDNLPICVEARVFIKDGNIQCMHAYWPEGAIQDWVDRENRYASVLDSWEGPNIRADWKEVLARQNRVVFEDEKLLRKYAKQVIGVMGNGYWSVDFALDKYDNWWLIDMAEGEKSFHNECKFAPAEEKEEKEVVTLVRD